MYPDYSRTSTARVPGRNGGCLVVEAKGQQDHRLPFVLAVPLDLSAEDFSQSLRDNVPGVPAEFELCRVSSTREVVPLADQCPLDIRNRRELNRSNSYLRPKRAPSQSPAGIGRPARGAIKRAPSHSPAGFGRPARGAIKRAPSHSPAGFGRPARGAIKRAPSHSPAGFGRPARGAIKRAPSQSPAGFGRPARGAIKVSLDQLILRFQLENIDTERPLTVAVRRQNVLKSAFSVLSRSYFEWQREPRMEFLNEMADDYGGPRREFQRLLMMAIQGTLWVFEGRSNELFFTYDLRALEQQKFFKVGKLTAWSVAHGGPGPRSISRSVYLLMCHHSAPLSDLDVGVLLDEDKGGKLQQLKACRTEEDLQRLKVSCGDWVSDCGVPSFYTSTLQEMPQVIERVVANYCFHRVASMVQQYTAGLNSCGRFFDLVSANWQQFLPIFCSTGGKLTRQTFRGLFLTDWSPEGSNARGEEEETIFQYDDWLIKVEEGEVDATFEDLLVFVTGAGHPPALGFPRKCEVHFFDQEPGTRRLPYASTCALFLYLPRGVREEEDFADMMSTSLVGSLGFGKV
ncbi:unnamed protein product [Gadus morhua 'NCC']